MKSIKESVRKILPHFMFEQYHINFPSTDLLEKFKYLNKEVEKLAIVEAISLGNGFVKIVMENGKVFNSFETVDKLEAELGYKALKKETQQIIPRECLRAAYDIVHRYVYPHMEVNSKPPYNQDFRRHFHGQHFDTIDDFPYSEKEKEKLKKVFSFKYGETVLDIGPHIGFGAMKVSEKVGDTGKIICIEADKPSFQLLEKNIRENEVSNVFILNKAVWNEKKIMKLQQEHYQSNSIVNNVLQNAQTFTDIQADTIDNIVRDLKLSKVDAINLTINGAEPQALEGAKDTILSNKHIRISLAGWYKIDGRKIKDIVRGDLESLGLEVKCGNRGKLLAWK